MTVMDGDDEVATQAKRVLSWVGGTSKNEVENAIAESECFRDMIHKVILEVELATRTRKAPHSCLNRAKAILRLHEAAVWMEENVRELRAAQAWVLYTHPEPFRTEQGVAGVDSSVSKEPVPQ